MRKESLTDGGVIQVVSFIRDYMIYLLAPFLPPLSKVTFDRYLKCKPHLRESEFSHFHGQTFSVVTAASTASVEQF